MCKIYLRILYYFFIQKSTIMRLPNCNAVKVFVYSFLLLGLTHCSKSFDNPEQQLSVINKIKPDLLPGPCPYNCHDTRCKAYAGGYCGPAPADTIPIIKNSANPYDNAGAQHNAGLRSLLASLSMPYTDSATLIKDKQYITTLGFNSDSAQLFYNHAVSLGYFPFSVIPELDSLGNSLNSKNYLSSYANTYVQSIFSKLTLYLNSDTGSVTKYNSFATSLISIESSISSDSHLTSYEKQVLLSSSAIGRYSASFWGNILSGSGGGGSNAIIRPLIFQKWARWLRVAMCDIGGGLIGISGGAVGIIFGAVGSSIIADASI